MKLNNPSPGGHRIGQTARKARRFEAVFFVLR